MNRDREILDSVLGGLLPPEPPHELQVRVLRGATATLSRPPRRDVWTRIWANRPLRVAWAAAVLVLLAANVVVPQRQKTGWAAGATARVHPRPGDELDAVTRLPRIDLATLPAGERGVTPRVERPKPAHPRAKTKESAS
jgi:hypothetical protein